MATVLPFGICTSNFSSFALSLVNSTFVSAPSHVILGSTDEGVKRVPVSTTSASTVLFRRGSDGKHRSVSRNTASVYSLQIQRLSCESVLGQRIRTSFSKSRLYVDE